MAKRTAWTTRRETPEEAGTYSGWDRPGTSSAGKDSGVQGLRQLAAPNVEGPWEPPSGAVGKNLACQGKNWTQLYRQGGAERDPDPSSNKSLHNDPKPTERELGLTTPSRHEKQSRTRKTGRKYRVQDPLHKTQNKKKKTINKK